MTQEDVIKQWIKECITESLNSYTQHFTKYMEAKFQELEKGYKTNRWIFTPEVQQILNVSPQTVKRLRKANAIPYTKIGNTCFYPSIYFEKIILDNIKKQYQKLFDE